LETSINWVRVYENTDLGNFNLLEISGADVSIFSKAFLGQQQGFK
jgi:hypothetical protein